MSTYARMVRRRRCGLVVGAVFVAGAVFFLLRHDPDQEVAEAFAQQQLGVSSVETVKHRSGGPCKVYEVRTPDRVTHRVVLLLEGDPPKFTPLYVTQKYVLSDFEEDDDGGCGMYAARALAVGPDGVFGPVGPQ